MIYQAGANAQLAVYSMLLSLQTLSFEHRTTPIHTYTHQKPPWIRVALQRWKRLLTGVML